MGYVIEFSYEDDFVELMNSLKKKYGEGIFDLDGIGKQLDLNAFGKGFFTSKVTADASVDPNSNVDDTSIITYNIESNKSQLRLDSYYMLWDAMKKNNVPKEVREEIMELQINGGIYINDFHGISSSSPYCFNYSTLDVLYQGLPMVKKITSVAPKHLLAFKSQIEQFVVIAANSTLGATGMADLIISMSYYMKHILETKSDAHVHFVSEEDCYEYYKQQVTSVIYTFNQPQRGNQSPFTNVSIYDHPFMESICEGIVFPDGSTPDLDLIDKLQDLFLDVMNEELERTPITFPVVTACVSVENKRPKDLDFLRKMVEKNLKYGFINFYFGSTATLSSCCRLRSNTNNEFFNSFGAGSTKIGSLGVVTINFPRLAYLARDKDDFEQNLRKLVQYTGIINEAKRALVRHRISTGHMPLYSLEFMEEQKQYSTTGVNGFYECLQLLDVPLDSEEGQAYAVRIMKILNEEIDKMQQLYKAPHNCEQVPGENSSIKLCKKDKYLGYDIGVELYSNQFIPLTYPTDILNRIKIQGLLDEYFSGGSVLHLNIEEEITDVDSEVDLLLYCIKSGVIYTAICYLLNQCENSHMTVGHLAKCPICGAKIIGKYQRVVGFLTCVEFWHEVRRTIDFPNRVFYNNLNTPEE